MRSLYGDDFSAAFDCYFYVFIFIITYSGITSHHMSSYDHNYMRKMAKNVFFRMESKGYFYSAPGANFLHIRPPFRGLMICTFWFHGHLLCIY